LFSWQDWQNVLSASLSFISPSSVRDKLTEQLWDIQRLNQ